MGFGITVVHIGKTASLWQQPLERYERLLKPYGGVTLTSVRAETAVHLDKREVMDREGARLLEKAGSAGYTVALTERGACRTSADFARWLSVRRESGSSLVMVVGGAYGLAPDVLEGCREQISLSTLTLAHELCLVVLLEQLYRACTILAKHPYHK